MFSIHGARHGEVDLLIVVAKLLGSHLTEPVGCGKLEWCMRPDHALVVAGNSRVPADRLAALNDPGGEDDRMSGVVDEDGYEGTRFDGGQFLVVRPRRDFTHGKDPAVLLKIVAHAFPLNVAAIRIRRADAALPINVRAEL